ncbi:MAG: hydroxymethylpyrimidine/phosphomethylpyrimidine kinase [Deltaproteobacteria bacterium]|nr:hydroxymethylpyrimidine/phosphomethylpyrimidine kinase [Deltaproteobacteria bacterium]
MHKKVLIIGGSDPSCGAGIQADLAVIYSLKIPCACVITALTAQNENKFYSFQSATTKNFQDQLESISIKPKNLIVKIGMLANAELVTVLLHWLKKNAPAFVILDPVFRSSTGFDLLNKTGIELLQKNSACFDLMTPNVEEFETLSGFPIKNEKDYLEKAVAWQRQILKQNPNFNLLIKGGHLKESANDYWISSEEVFKFKGKRILKNKETHGTGCSLASFIAAYLAKGKNLKSAVVLAKKEVLKKIHHS